MSFLPLVRVWIWGSVLASVAGWVLSGVGQLNAAGYAVVGNWITGTFDIPYTGDPIKLLTGGAYINFHSTAFPAGECRGQVRASDETPATRLTNISTRGFVGPGNQVLIEGLIINGPDPVRLLITAKGPSLTALGVTGALAEAGVVGSEQRRCDNCFHNFLSNFLKDDFRLFA